MTADHFPGIKKKVPAVAGPLDQPVGRPVPERTRLWRVVRYVREEFEVEAATREEAKGLVNDPHTVTITHETCVAADGKR